MCLRQCPKEHITAPQVSIAKISCERLLLSKTCVIMRKNCLLITPIILTESLVHGWLFKISSIISSVFVTHITAFANSCCKSWNEFHFPDRSGQVKVQMTWKFLLSYLKVLEKSETLLFTVSQYLFSFQSYKGLKNGKMIEKMVQRSG